jgi:divalent metal cation (Fe/Co/Zn/Cd) transporter
VLLMSPDQRVELALLPTLPGPTHTDSDGCCPACHDANVDDPLWQRAARQVRWLSWVSLVWMCAEGAIGLLAGIRDASIALVSWALGSVIEGLASVIVIWRFTGTRTAAQHSERQAQRAVAVSFFLLAPYIAVEAVRDLISGHTASPSLLGMAITASSLVLMPLLWVVKQRLARVLDSGATAGEAIQNLLCAAQAGAVLLGLAATAAFGWSWLDPIVALSLAAWAVREGVSSWKGTGCC